MKLVIDIPEGFFEEVRKDPSVLAPPFLSCEKVGEIIANGKPLPKCYGRLGDLDKLEREMYHEAFETDTDLQKRDSGCWIRYKMFENAIANASTIIEAYNGGD